MALAHAVSDTTSVSRTPKDEQKVYTEIYRVICVYVTRLRERERQVDTAESRGCPARILFFRANPPIGAPPIVTDNTVHRLRLDQR